jgi:outer membrane protein assembly factor BamB
VHCRADLPSIGRFLALLALFFWTPPDCTQAQFGDVQILSSDVTVPEAGQATLSQLQRADKFLTERQYADAIDTLRRTSDLTPDDLVPATGKQSPKGFVTYHPLAAELQRRFAALGASSPEALQRYRGLVDPAAETLLKAAQRDSNETQLQQIFQQYFASSVGDDAALLAGDAALARGDAVAARRYWLPLHATHRTSDEAAAQWGVYPALPWFFASRGKPLADDLAAESARIAAAGGTSPMAIHPDAQCSPADVGARLILASLLEGNTARAEWEWERFRRQHPTAEGKLAGRAGRYVDLLQPWFELSRNEVSRSPQPDWLTFAGSPSRNRVAEPATGLGSPPRWSIDLPRLGGQRELVGQGRLRVAEEADGLLSYHPIVEQGLVLVTDGQTLQAFDAETGKPAWQVLLREQPLPAPLTHQQVGVPRFTLTAAQGLVIATLPTPVVPARRAPTVRREDLSRIVAIDTTTRKLVFEAVADDATMVFEGTPLLDRGRVYVSVRKQAESRPQSLAACYDLASGRQIWQRQICSADSLGHGDLAEYGNSLVTLSHDTLYINTNLGAVAALDTAAGAIRWLVKYPRAAFPSIKPERSDRHFFRDLNPCLVQQGQVICAPADSDRIFSLDATSGQLVWTLPPGEAVDAIHLLGVSGEHLLASGDYLYWIDVVRGRIVTQYPQAVPVGPGLALPTPRGWGRGILAGDRVYWPTASSLHVFAAAPEGSGVFYEPRLVQQIDLAPLGAGGGNLVIAQGQAVLATADALHALAATPAATDGPPAAPQR